MQQSFGLLASVPVQTFIGMELDVQREIMKFFIDERGSPHPDILDVVGPPSPFESLKAHNDPSYYPALPMVRFTLRKVRNQTTGEPGIEVRCSDTDHDKIVDWLRWTAQRHATHGRRAA